MKTIWGIVSLVFLVGCGGDDEDAPADARVVDAPALDAAELDAAPPDAEIADAMVPPDAEIDAMVTTYSGAIDLVEEATLNPGNSGTFFGQGARLSASFLSSADGLAPVMEEQPGSPLGCKAWVMTPAQAALARGHDEGSLTLVLTGAGAPSYPTCTFDATAGYRCPHTGTFSTGGTIAAGPAAGTLTLTDADVTFNANNTTNRYVEIVGATNPGNNGVFPILAVAAANTIVYGNPAGNAEALPAAATHINLAAIGPTPQAPDPGFLANDVALGVTLTMGGGNNFATFTATTPTSIGDDFTLALAELQRLNAIPLDGNEFTITCDAAGCPAGSATATILDLTTTDAPTAGLSPFAMPAPTNQSVRVLCRGLGVTAITVPSAFSALLQSANATRVRTSFARVVLLAGGPANVIVTAGHATVGYTTP